VDLTSGVVWSRGAEPSTLAVEWSLAPSFDQTVVVRGAPATPESDLVAKVRIAGFPAGRRIFYRARFEGERMTEWNNGSFGTAPDRRA